MSHEEQSRMETLQEQLASANRASAELRSHFSSALGESNHEARLYRGLFWCLLALASIAAILRIIE